MIKTFTALLLLICCQLAIQAQPPAITSFEPLGAPAGALITIRGNHFDPVADSNMVYFGTVRASVQMSSDTSIVATVPPGSMYRFITVQKDTFTAFSRLPFVTTYGSGLQLRNNSFGEPSAISAARYPCFGDFDSDGRIDMVGIINNNKIASFRNTDSAGYPVFGSGPSYATTTDPAQVITADFNADGKPDIAVAGTTSASVWLYSNTSTAGSISFAAPVYYLLGSDNYTYTLDANDIDGDGKTDLIISYAHQGTCFSIARNNGTGGAISFAGRLNYAFGTVPGGAGNVGDANKIYVADIDGDGKPDVTSLSRYFPPFLIFRNTSTPGTVSFAPKVSITSNRNTSIGNGYFDMKLADIDGDDKPEILYVSSDSTQLSVYRNTSSPGLISFSAKMNFDGPYPPIYVAVNDLNGDGKVDVAVLAWDSVVVYQNSSTTGSLSFLSRRSYTGNYVTQDMGLVDLDADGKADIIISGTDVNSNNANRTFLLKNRLDETVPVSTCINADSIVLEAGIAGSVFQWQVNTGNGFIDVTDDTIHAGSTSPLLVLNHPLSAWYGHQYRCVVDGRNDAVQYLKFTARWIGGFSNVWENPQNWGCSQLPDANTDVLIPNGFPVVGSRVQIRSIRVSPGASVTIRSTFSMEVMH